ncbi:MAG TPA: PspC domain-containing protein [Candidatus Paceibacterota bacterium]|nr:PspC domain-containing protein [Candidatus Paceibacterota bacterium]
MHKKLTRSTEHRVIAGVMGGIAEFVDTDPNAIRLIYALLTIFSGFIPGIIGYIVAMLILPVKVTITPSEPVRGEDDSAAV